MANKKAASAAKKPATKATAKKPNASNVTTVKAVESRPAAEAQVRSRKFGLNRTPLVAALIAEFVGTFIFAGLVLATQGTFWVVGLGLVGVVLAVGTVSGGYVNPALVLGAWLTRRMSGKRALLYIVAQVLGAMLALVILNAYSHAVPAASTDMYSNSATLFKAAALPNGKEWLVFFSEFIGALVFGFAVAGATREKKERTAAAFTVGFGAFLGLAIAGTAAMFVSAHSILNPAVAVALQAIDFSSVWPVTVYVLGSSLGAIAGFFLYDLLRTAEDNA